MAAKKFHGARALLNLPGFETTAAIVAEIEDTSTWKEGMGPDGKPIEDKWHICPDYNFQISDCSRSVSFSVGVDDAEDVKNSLHKVDTMISALEKLRAGIEVEGERMKARQKILKKNARRR